MRLAPDEYDLADGARARRGRWTIDALLDAVPAAEDAHVTTNGAAALVLIATALAQAREITVSRGELIEIGDGFRLPDQLTSTGARLREVGTTNRTHLADYAAAVGPGTGWTQLPSGVTAAFADVPGHHRFITNMLAGVGPVPAVLLVIAADEDWSRQTEEHVAALTALNVRHGLIAVTRTDLAPPETHSDADRGVCELREHALENAVGILCDAA